MCARSRDGEQAIIAAEYGAPCQGSKTRFELLGSDLDLVLMNDHQRICERLHRTGDFILFSGQAGLLFEDGVKASQTAPCRSLLGSPPLAGGCSSLNHS